MSDQHSRPKFRWHIIVFLAPAVLVYTAVMIYLLFNTLRLSLFTEVDQQRVFVGLQNFQTPAYSPMPAIVTTTMGFAERACSSVR